MNTELIWADFHNAPVLSHLSKLHPPCLMFFRFAFNCGVLFYESPLQLNFALQILKNNVNCVWVNIKFRACLHGKECSITTWGCIRREQRPRWRTSCNKWAWAELRHGRIASLLKTSAMPCRAFPIYCHIITTPVSKQCSRIDFKTAVRRFKDSFESLHGLFCM